MNTNVNDNTDEDQLCFDLHFLSLERSEEEEEAEEAAEEAAETMRLSLMSQAERDSENEREHARIQRFCDAVNEQNANASRTRSGQAYSLRKVIHS